MGQKISKDMRSRLENSTLQELLSDNKYVEELGQHLPRLPKRSHSNLAKLLASWQNKIPRDSAPVSRPNSPSTDSRSSRKRRTPRTYGLGSLWSIKAEDISIPSTVADALKQNHNNLLRQSSQDGVVLQSPSDYYEYTCNVETSRTLNKILWRFLTTCYYDLISELDASKRRVSLSEHSGVAYVVAIICQSGKHDPNIVREKVVDWANKGRRYRGFMDALCPGCLVLLPEKISDLVWEKYVPIKGDTFGEVIQFLQDLGIIHKCREDGWNELSNKILDILREPFRRFIPFQFQPSQQSQIRWAQNPSLASAACDADIQQPERPTSGRDRPQRTQGYPSARTTRNSRILPKLPANRIAKRRKDGTTSMCRQPPKFAGDFSAHLLPHLENTLSVGCQSYHESRAHSPETQHATHGKSPQCQIPNVSKHWLAPAPNDCRQWQLVTSHDDSHLPYFQLPTNCPAGDTPNEISMNASKRHDLNEQIRTGESISHISRLERRGINTISALLNHDSNTQATIPPTTQVSHQGLKDCSGSGLAGQQGVEQTADCGIRTELHLGSVPTTRPSNVTPFATATNLLRAIRFDKRTLQRIVLEHPENILGGIWFGSPAGFQPFVSLRLSRALDTIVKQSGHEVYAPGPPTDASRAVTGVAHLIKIGVFRQMIRRDGFGDIFWNECGEEAFVRMDVVDEQLAADFVRDAVPD